MTRQRPTSLHVSPVGGAATARHYLRDLVYGGIDGVITTFAVVAGVRGGEFAAGVAIVIGVANLFADGLSMGVGNFLSIRSNEGARRAAGLAEEESEPARHAAATFAAFVVAGSVPMLPFLFAMSDARRFVASIVLTLATLLGAGLLRAYVTGESRRASVAEMLGLGAIVAAVAYYVGRLVASLGGML
ncbi:MAG: VIT1/CCC1 transporter family protein [Acidobacteriota bacterium]|nr:VIT1/CCC1 transporter family protein [Acidobacteriota bacterium]